MTADSPTTSGVDPRIARTHARVLDAAWEVLAEVGFDRVTIELISERSGVARSTMYRHWTTREEILRDAFSARACHGPAHHDPAGDASAGRDPTPDARAALTSYAVTFAAGLACEWGRAAVTMATRALDEPGQRTAVRTFADGAHADLHSIVGRAVAEEALPSDTDLDARASLLADLVIAPLFYRYQMLGEPADAAAATSLAQQAWQVLCSTT